MKDCALAAIATGRRAQNLKELRNELEGIDLDSVYYHFWGGLVRPQFDDPRFNNDFARWVHSALRNTALAERLSVIDPTDFADLEDLRQEVIEVLEEELDQSEVLPWTSREAQFHFIRSQIVVFDTHRVVEEPGELPGAIAAMSNNSVFYHFVDARRRTPGGVDDFRSWLSDLPGDYEELALRCQGVDPFYQTLSELKAELVQIFTEHLGGDRS
ncbi:MAG: hypothetical protein GF405_01620 [Candidatus Eisenbacteria bacterium]|nr:hypothetical protein [Candidatus Eisenbacteria bacterium]